MPAIPISPPKISCFLTIPVNKKTTPMVVIARKSWRTRSDATPTIKPITAAMPMAGIKVMTIGTPALLSMALV